MFKTFVNCCCPPEDHDDERYDESSYLIRNGGSQSFGGSSYGSSNVRQVTNDKRNGSAPNAADDEQAILARILRQTADNVIDVSAADSHTVDAREYMERARKYNQQLSTQITATSLQQTMTSQSGANRRVSAAGTPSQQSGVAISRCLLTDISVGAMPSSANVSTPDRMLAAPPLSSEEAAAIRQFSSQISRAVQDIKVEHKEDLVIPFVPS